MRQAPPRTQLRVRVRSQTQPQALARSRAQAQQLPEVQALHWAPRHHPWLQVQARVRVRMRVGARHWVLRLTWAPQGASVAAWRRGVWPGWKQAQAWPETMQVVQALMQPSMLVQLR